MVLLPDPDREPVTTIGADVAGLGGEPMQNGDLSPAELQRALVEGGVSRLIDVREPWQHRMNTIEEAVNIPLTQLAERQTPPPGLEEATEAKPLVLYCAHGTRSRHAVELLPQRYPDSSLRNLLGGFELYRSSGACSAARP